MVILMDQQIARNRGFQAAIGGTLQKNVFLKMYLNSQEYTTCTRVFFNKVAGLSLQRY